MKRPNSLFTLLRPAVFCVTIGSLLFSCAKEPPLTRAELIEKEVTKRVNRFIKNKKDECQSTTMDLAIARTDSLLKLNAVKYVEDSLIRPPLPEKPQRQFLPPPKDSIQNRPFLHEFLKDSLPPTKKDSAVID